MQKEEFVLVLFLFLLLRSYWRCYTIVEFLKGGSQRALFSFSILKYDGISSNTAEQTLFDVDAMGGAANATDK